MKQQTAPIAIGSGFRRFLFAAGALGMLHIEVRGNSLQDAIDFIRDPDVVNHFPSPLNEEIQGQDFRLIRELE